MGPLPIFIEDKFLVFGVLTLIYLSLKFLNGAYKFFKMYFTCSPLDYKIFGKWALVTGATDGIGKGIAVELAKRGLNIALASRNQEKLRSVAQEIENSCNVDTRCITIDFSISDAFEDETRSSVYDALIEGIKDLDIGIVVNNVGASGSGSFLHPFSAHSNKERRTGRKIEDMIYCNDLSMSRVTGIILPQMIQKKRGLVINLSSLAATIVMPNSAVYSASKRFNDILTKGLNDEYKKHGVIFQSVQPGRVRTNMTGRDDHNAWFMYPEYETYAKDLLESMGKDIQTSGYYFHGLLRILITTLPEWIVSKALLLTRRG